MKRLLPIGIQDFATIREDGFCYVDKTARIHELISDSSRVFFLSRPRRFGKSLLCSTLRAIFEGRRELFAEIAGQRALAIDSLAWEWKKHPVISLDLSPINYNMGVDRLDKLMHNSLGNIANDYGLALRGDEISVEFSNLIKDLYEHFGEKVVVIIDEYDSPLLDTIDKREIHLQLREKLKGFYGVLKSSGALLRFVFLTGVTKFSHVSIFSSLNNLSDLTLDPKYADICGLTEEEVFENYEPEIAGVLAESGIGREEYVGKLRRFYNGYRFTKKPLKVYNPFGMLLHLRSGGEFRSYWYDTGTPTFLIKLISEQKINILDLSNLQVGLADFQRYDIENLMVEPILYQSGYLTIEDYNEKTQMYSLEYPNEEVRSCFARSLLDHYLVAAGTNPGRLNNKLGDALYKGDIEGAMAALRQFLAAIPYDIVKDSENYYQTAVFLIFKILGYDCRAEVRIAAGRIDTLVEMHDYVYCFEFKLDGSADKALAQIDTKEYLLPWEGSGKKLYKVGVDFDTKQRNIGAWKYCPPL
ncbi:MAG: ATP-binding protein [Lachnospiraceae bacterium]|jgi:hypothetical protein|nr:ATP-binding protein [Lachnospiraceae bacterium]